LLKYSVLSGFFFDMLSRLLAIFAQARQNLLLNVRAL